MLDAMADLHFLRTRLERVLLLAPLLGVGCDSTAKEPTPTDPAATKPAQVAEVAEVVEQPAPKLDLPSAPAADETSAGGSGGQGGSSESGESGATSGSGGAAEPLGTLGIGKNNFRRMPSCSPSTWCVPPAKAKARASGKGRRGKCPKQVKPPSAGGRVASLNTNTKDFPLASKGDCCYSWMGFCGGGRPLLDGAVPLLAEVSIDGTVAAPDSPARRAGEGWLRDALAEHASVPAFLRAARELEQVGAPAELVAACSAAAKDELRHARDCFAMASRLLGGRVRPHANPVAPPRRLDLPGLAVSVVLEGCIGETIGAAQARVAASRCADPQARAILAAIAEDEARHAELAWKTLAWMLREGGAAVIEQIRPLLARPQAADVGAEPEPSELAALGQLDTAARESIAKQTWAEVIEPVAASLLAHAA